MFGRVIDVALKQRLLVFLSALALAVWGANAFLKLPIDAFPDVAPVRSARARPFGDLPSEAQEPRPPAVRRQPRSRRAKALFRRSSSKLPVAGHRTARVAPAR